MVLSDIKKKSREMMIISMLYDLTLVVLKSYNG